MDNDHVNISSNSPRKPACPHCGGTNIHYQAISNTRTTGRKSCAYWVIVGWWLEPLLWLVLTLPKLIYELFKPKKIKTTVSTVAVCQTCGYRWNANPYATVRTSATTSVEEPEKPVYRPVQYTPEQIAEYQAKQKRTKLIILILSIPFIIFVLSAAITGIIQGASGNKTSETSTQSSAEVSTAASKASDAGFKESKSATAIHCDTLNVLGDEYFKAFGYYGSGELVYKGGWVVPKGKYEARVARGKTWIQLSIYVAEDGKEPKMTEHNKTPILLPVNEMTVIEFDGNEYLSLTEPDYVTLTLIEE